MSRIYLYSLNSIIMWLNVKKYFENGVANIQNAWKRAFATLATVAALSGTLTSCNSPEVKASGDAVTAGFEYVHSNGSAEPTRYQYNVEIRKVGDKCIATLDGDWFDNHEFVGTTDEVFWQVSNFLYEKSVNVTQSEEVATKTKEKIKEMRVAYDSIANAKK